MRTLLYICAVLLLYGCGDQRNATEAISSAEVIESDGQVNQAQTDQSSEQVALWARVSKAGLFRVVRSGGIVEHPQSSTGKVISKPVIELVAITDRIPLIKDAHMSLQYRIGYLPDAHWITLRRVLKHPQMILPDGTTTTGSDYTFKGKVSVGQVIGYTGYGLNEDYEMLEGEWIFQLWYQDKKLIEQKFITYKPNEDELQWLRGLLSPAEGKGLKG